MGAQAAARLGDEIAHGFGLAAMIAGAVVGAVVGAAVIAATAATGGAAAVILAGAIAAGGLSAGSILKGLNTIFNLPEPTTGILILGSLDVLTNKRPAMRASLDAAAACNGILLAHPMLPGPIIIAEGSKTVLINRMPASRLKDKLVCGAHIKSGSPNVVIGGPTARTAFVFDVEGWVHTGLEVLGVGALVAGGALAALAGAGAFAAFAGITAATTAGFAGLGELGNRLGPGYADLFQGIAGMALLLASPKLGDFVEPEEAPSPGRVVLSGHGSYEGGTFTVPEGTSVTVYSEHGAQITDELGNRIELGQDVSNVYSRTYGPGEQMPDYTLHPPTGLNVQGNPTTVPGPTPLSNLVQPGMGDVHWAACTYENGAINSEHLYGSNGVYDKSSAQWIQVY